MKWKNDPRKVKIRVFATLCFMCADFMYGWVPHSCPKISWYLKISLYKCRKAMKSLVADGLAERTAEISTVIYGNDVMIPINGFTITKKAKETEIYKYMIKREERIIKEVYGWDIEL